VGLTPEEIEAHRFRLAPNGYECEAVDRFLVEVVEALRDQPVGASDADEFSRAGQEIASLLRAARDSAGAMRAEAEGLAASMRSRAELETADRRQQVEAEAEQATVALIEAQQRAEAMLRQAEQQATATLAAATSQAAARATQITAEAERQAEQIRRGEQAAHHRLVAARTDLQQAIDRLDPSDERPVLDLTVPPPHLRTEAVGATDREHRAVDPNSRLVSATAGHEPAEPGPPDPDVAGDPLLRMVRAAVGRAAQHSSSHGLENEVPAV
jgi:DivIVA domain-containing protein